MYQDHVSYDPEAVIQEADMLMAEYAAEAAAFEAAEARGECTHTSWIGLPDSGKVFYPEQEDLEGDEVRCTAGCGQKFENDEAICRASMDVVN